MDDLVGVRALHLFKDDCFDIDAELKKVSKIVDKPVAYIRDGDQGEVTRRFTESGFDIQVHRAGYRSIHYVVESQPLKRKVYTEIQVRTIFEEGWSEIDHSVRYPNFSEDELVDYFLTIFNRMAGSADEMGGFVRNLAVHLKAFNAQVDGANREKEEVVQSMQKLVTDLQKAKKDDLESRGKLELLSVELEKLKRANDSSCLQSHLPYFKPFELPKLDYLEQTLREADAARRQTLGFVPRDFLHMPSAPIYPANALFLGATVNPQVASTGGLQPGSILIPQIKQANEVDQRTAIPPTDKPKDKK